MPTTWPISIASSSSEILVIDVGTISILTSRSFITSSRYHLASLVIDVGTVMWPSLIVFLRSRWPMVRVLPSSTVTFPVMYCFVSVLLIYILYPISASIGMAISVIVVILDKLFGEVVVGILVSNYIVICAP